MANLLVNAGRAIITNLLIGAGSVPQYAGWGTGAGTTGVTDTTLFSEKALDLSSTSGTRVTATCTRQTTSVTNDTWQAIAAMTATGAGTVTNFGVFDNSAIGSGNLFVKGDFTGIALNSGDSITFTAKLQFT